MPSRTDVLVANLEELQQDLRDLWQALTRDPVKEARKERAWTILAGVFTAVGAIAARRAAPTPKKGPPGPSGGGPSSRGDEAQAETEQTTAHV